MKPAFKNRINYRLSIFILVFYILFKIDAIAQNKKPDSAGAKENSIYLNVGGSALFLGVAYEKMLSEKFSIEFGMGYGTATLGGRYYFTNTTVQRWNFYTGLSHTYFDSNDGYFYLPIGISYLSKRNLLFAFDIGLQYWAYWVEEGKIVLRNNRRIDPFLGFKAGYKFGKLSKPKGHRNTIHSIQLEAGGTGILYSLRYDLNKELFRPFIKAAFAPGISYGGRWKGAHHLLFPVKLTMLAGGDLNIEGGVDVAMGYYTSYNWRGHPDQHFNVHLFPYLGGRYQERTKGITLGIGTILMRNKGVYTWWMSGIYSPYFPLKESSWILWPSVNIGYTIRH